MHSFIRSFIIYFFHSWPVAVRIKEYLTMRRLSISYSSSAATVPLVKMAVRLSSRFEQPFDRPGINDTLRLLEHGSALTVFYRAKRPDAGLFRVKLETRQLVGSIGAGKSSNAAAAAPDSPPDYTRTLRASRVVKINLKICPLYI